jgi:hypothetical protein
MHRQENLIRQGEVNKEERKIFSLFRNKNGSSKKKMKKQLITSLTDGWRMCHEAF